MVSEKSIEEIRETVRSYVDGVVDFDFEKGESAWHQEGLKIGLDSQGQNLITRTIQQTRPNLSQEGIDVVRKQISQNGTIESIDRTGNAASVKLVWNYERGGQKKRITDYIFLLRSNKGWKIVGKIFNEESR
ncbi:MAG: nuclear transport factor 2 family protein [Candidatus Thorarchaeota archaeon]|jgi:hypothetical protein